MIRLISLSNRFSSREWKPNALHLFSKVIYAWFIIHLIWILPIADDLWGTDALILPLSNKPGLINNFFFVLNYVRDAYAIVLLIHGVAALCSLLGLFSWVPRLLVYLTGGMLYFSAYLAFNSGFLLMWLFSFYLIFSSVRVKEDWGRVRVNFVYLALVVQFCIVYAVSALWKWTGIDWIQGTAVAYTLQMDHFSTPWLRDLLLPLKGATSLLTWSALLYQTLFVFLVWWKKVKYLWLGIGVMFHLYIITIMGMVDFGTAMMSGYILFLDDAICFRILRKLRLVRSEK